MTTAVDHQTVHPRTHPAKFWRARLGAMASRGETDGLRVAEARKALRYWRVHSSLAKDMSAEAAHDLMEIVWADEAKAETAVAQ